MFRHVLKKDGTRAFATQLVETKAQEIMRRGCVRAEGEKDDDPLLRATALVVKLCRSLIESSSIMTLTELVGQILWRQRRSLKHSKHRRIAESTLWLEDKSVPYDVVQMVNEVYKHLTQEDGGEMKSKHWHRAVSLICRNPVIGGRVKLSDVDRLFYCETHQGTTTSAHPSITSVEFRLLLLQLAEASGVHPINLFVACGCHAETLQQAAEEKAQQRHDSRRATV